MEKITKEALQVTKEIVVKFIETGRVSPTNFSEVFPSIHQVVLTTITRPSVQSAQSGCPAGTDGEEKNTTGAS